MRNFVSEAWYINSLWFTWDNVWIDIGEGQFMLEWNIELCGFFGELHFNKTG